MKRHINSIAALIVVMVSVSTEVRAGVIAHWDFNGLGSSGGGPKYGPDGYAPAVLAEGVRTTEGLRRGAGHITSPNVDRANAWGGVDFPATDYLSALDNNQFFYFTLIVDTGLMSIESLETSLFRSDMGPNNFQWEYSLSVDGSAGWVFMDAGTANGSTGTPYSFDFGVGLIDIDVVTFRIVVWGDTVSRGTFYFHHSHTHPDLNVLTVNGTFTNVPEPATGLLALAGMGLLMARKRKCV